MAWGKPQSFVDAAPNTAIHFSCQVQKQNGAKAQREAKFGNFTSSQQNLRVFINTSPQLCSGYQGIADRFASDISGHDYIWTALVYLRTTKCILELELDVCSSGLQQDFCCNLCKHYTRRWQ